jgi:hypothetical protein
MNKREYSVGVGLLVILLMVNCSSPKKIIPSTTTSSPTIKDTLHIISPTTSTSNAPKEAPINDTLLYFKQGACFGKCPVRWLLIRQDGNGLLNCDKNCGPTGKFTSKLSSTQVNELNRLLASMPAGNNTYPSNGDFITDLPISNFIFYTRSISGNIKYQYDVPTTLFRATDYIKVLMEEIDWHPMPKD